MIPDDLHMLLARRSEAIDKINKAAEQLGRIRLIAILVSYISLDRLEGTP